MWFSDVVSPKMSYLDWNDLYLVSQIHKCFHIPLSTWAQTHCQTLLPTSKQAKQKQELTALGILISLLATDFVAQQIHHLSPSLTEADDLWRCYVLSSMFLLTVGLLMLILLNSCGRGERKTCASKPLLLTLVSKESHKLIMSHYSAVAKLS